MNVPAALPQQSSLKERLEAVLAAGGSATELMVEIGSACAASSSAAWEALSLVDQYYRRRRISEDVYRAVKHQTEHMVLGRPVASEATSARGAMLGELRSSAPKTSTPVARRGAVESGPGKAAVKPVAAAAENTPAPVPVPVPVPAPVPALARSGPPQAGQLLRGRYLLEARLDYGDGLVFQALDQYRKDLPDTEQRVAIRFPANAAAAQREFYHAQQLSHPNIARVNEFDRDGDAAFYTMELQQGRLLRDLLKQADRVPLPEPQVLSIVRDIAAAIQHAHSRGVVHGRLNTSSVMIAPDGGVRVLNFGLPRTEQETLDPRDDLTALAMIAFELFAGQHPFGGHSALEARQLGLRLRRPAGLQRRQWRTLQRGLAWSGKARNTSIAQWLEGMEVQRASEKPPTQKVLLHPPAPLLWPRRVAVAALIVLLLGGATAVAFNWLRQAPPASADSEAAMAAHADIVRDVEKSPPPVATAPATAPAAAAKVAPPVRVAADRAAPVAVTPVAAAPAAAAPVATVRAAAAPAVSAPSAATDAASGDDSSGSGRLAFQSESFTVAPGETAARIPVRRTGGTRGDVGLVWWTEGGTAHAGEDFVSFGQQRELIPNGQKSVVLYIPLSSDGARTGDTEFYVNIGEPSGGAKLGRIDRLKVIIAHNAQ